MEGISAMATLSSCSTSSSLLAASGSGQQANVQSLGLCRVLSGGVKRRGASGVRVATAERGNGVVRVVSKQAAVSTPTKESAVEKEVYDCVVVGAGISGLCTAQALATRCLPIASNAVSSFVPAHSNAGLHFSAAFAVREV